MEAPFADAVIVAAGASRRMDGKDKLMAPLLGRPLLAWSVEAMARAASVNRVIVVTGTGRTSELAGAGWLREAAQAAPGGLTVVSGGDQRAESVRAGLAVTNAAVVLVHDGARPLASSQLADAVAGQAARSGAAVPVVPVADSLRRTAEGRVTELISRDGVVAAQTPQAARRELLRRAVAAAPPEVTLTDEVALLAAHGVDVATVPGEATNIKVTRPADLEIVRALLAAREATPSTATGFGQDSHPFGPDDGLWLGGVLIDGAPRLFGHSDGDVALHAVANAILAASRLGDLGRHFPPTDPRTAGVGSASMLAAVVERTRAEGWRPVALQVSLLGARPRLGAQRLEEMRARIATITGLELADVAVTASSGNLAGAEGAGLAISASAFVTLAR